MIDLADSPAEAEFRGRLREWLAVNGPGEPASDSLEERHHHLVAWHRRLHEGGWVGLSWPREYGGQGLGPMQEAIFNTEVGRADVPAGLFTGYIGRPLLHFASEEHKRRYLPKLLSAEELWCQGFSEPEAGSDLASLQTRAVGSGGEFLISGQKIWTSYAQFADYCLLLARTSTEEPKHAGISAFIVDMRAPGITVAPLVMSTGDAEFCEVFFDETPVPAEQLVGRPGQGWQIALTTLAYERGPVDIGFQARYEVLLGRLAAAAQRTGQDGDAAVRRTLAAAAVSVEVLRLHCLRSLTARLSGGVPGVEGSIDKLLMASTEQRLLSAAVEVLGADALVGDETWFKSYLYSRAATVYGGTREIQKNILATRYLGLPRS